MNQKFEFHCVCGNHFAVQNGQIGGVYQCPSCGSNLRASVRIDSRSNQNRWGINVLIFVVVAILVGIASFVFRGRGQSDWTPTIDELIFVVIGDCQKDTYRETARSTEQLLNNMRESPESFSDPELLKLVELQLQFSRSFGEFVDSKEQAYAEPSLIPLTHWKHKLAYLRLALRLSPRYVPEWSEPLEKAIRRTEETINRLEGP